MSLMFTLLLVVQVLSALAIVVLVLLQQGKGADMGSAFGGGSAGSLFGATGAANFLSRSTKWAAVVFFISTAALAYVGSRPAGSAIQDGGVMDSLPVDLSVPSVPTAPEGSSQPATDVPAAPADVPAEAPGAVSGAADTPAAP